MKTTKRRASATARAHHRRKVRVSGMPFWPQRPIMVQIHARPGGAFGMRDIATAWISRKEARRLRDVIDRILGGDYER